MRCGAADRVGRLDANRQIDVGAVGVERVVAGQVQIGTSLPPAVPRSDDAVGQTRCLGARAPAPDRAAS